MLIEVAALGVAALALWLGSVDRKRAADERDRLVRLLFAESPAERLSALAPPAAARKPADPDRPKQDAKPLGI